MPTYDYKCDGCGHTFEEWQSFKDDALTDCPACHNKTLRRLFGGGAAIIFKGSGFYETDYRKGESYKKAEKADQDAGKPADAPKADAKTDGGPAAKADATPAAPAAEAKPAAKKAGE